jgi:hypothetical protein
VGNRGCEWVKVRVCTACGTGTLNLSIYVGLAKTIHKYVYTVYIRYN